MASHGSLLRRLNFLTRKIELVAMVKRHVIPNWRRVLELLASSADGCTETLLFAQGFTEATVAGLIDTGLVATTTKRVLDGQPNVDVTWFMITGRGRAALETVPPPMPNARGR
jgi:hypothetical protein